jgi:hypothetical protein
MVLQLFTLRRSRASAWAITSGGGVYSAVPFSVPPENVPFNTQTSSPICVAFALA